MLAFGAHLLNNSAIELTESDSKMSDDIHPLDKLIAIETDARAFGFDWPDAMTIIEQAESECEEIREVLQEQQSSERLQEEIGDLLHTAISLCLFAGFDPNKTLAQINQKFGGRMEALKAIAKAKGYQDLYSESFETMLKLWDEAKQQTDNQMK